MSLVNLRVVSVAALLIFVAPFSAGAQAVSYNSVSAFDAAAAPGTEYSFPNGSGTLINGSFTLGPFTFQAENFFDFGPDQGYSVSYLDDNQSPTETITDAGFSAVGFNIGTYDQADTVQIVVNGDQTFSLTTAGAQIPQFFGLISTDPITDIELTNVTELDGEIDILNLQTGATPAPTPEPSTLVLLGSGIASLGLLRRRVAGR